MKSTHKPFKNNSTIFNGAAPTEYEALAACSCIFWVLTFVATFKYIAIILTADHNGMILVVFVWSCVCE